MWANINLDQVFSFAMNVYSQYIQLYFTQGIYKHFEGICKLCVLLCHMVIILYDSSSSIKTVQFWVCGLDVIK